MKKIKGDSFQWPWNGNDKATHDTPHHVKPFGGCLEQAVIFRIGSGGVNQIAN